MVNKLPEDKKKEDKKEEKKESIKDRHDKIQTAILMQINNLLMDLNDKIDENKKELSGGLLELKEELSHKADKPGYYKVDEELQEIRQKTGFDKEADNFYDVRSTITIAQATDPNDFENTNYNRERIFQVLDRYAPVVQVTNDGQDDIFVRISHGGTTTFSNESRIRPGDNKKFWIVYELRLRSPTVGTPYRVTEYDILTNCCPRASANFFTSVAQGDIPNTIAGTRRARSATIPFTTTVIFSNVTSSSFPNNQPSVAQQMRLVSTSALDTTAGIGAQQVEITYLTAPDNPTEPFKKKTEIVTMNGTTPVNTVATNIFRIDYVRVSRVGSSGVAIGAISVQSLGGVFTYEQIPGASLNSASLTHYIEKGMGSMITDFTFGCTTTAGTVFSIVATKIDSSGNHVGDIVFQSEVANGALPNNLVTPLVTENPDGKETFFIATANGRASNQLGSGSFEFIDYPL